MKKYLTSAKAKVDAFLSWQWVKRFLYWLVVSGGTISECVFLLASIWVSVNATVHPLMLKLMSEAVTVTLSQLAVSAFTSLPEVILGLAVVTTYGHIKFYCIHRKKSSMVWAILFGLPTVVFASLTTWTLASSALQIGYQMPSVLVATRVLAGYAYGFLSMLFVLIGEPDNADYVGGLKDDIESLNLEIERVTSRFETALQTANHNFQIAMQSKQNEFEYQLNLLMEQSQNEIEYFQNLIESQNEQVKKLSERASSVVSSGLENYPKVLTKLVNSGIKTVSVDDLSELTGISKRRINAAKMLQRTSRNKDLIFVSSVIEWLKTLPPTTNKSGPITDPLSLNGHAKITTPLNGFTELKI
jgi:hypothetical protein